MANQRLVPERDPEEPEPPPEVPLLLRLLSRLEPSGMVEVPDWLPEPLMPESDEAPPLVEPLPWPLRGASMRWVPGGQASDAEPEEPLAPLFLLDFCPVVECLLPGASGTHSLP